MPFVNISERRDQEYFSDGLSEKLIDRLARSPELKVIARTSSFQFKGRNEDVRTIAASLGVAHVLEGSVRTSDREIRITVQLIRAVDGVHVWSETYSRRRGDIFELQDDLAAAVTQALTIRLVPKQPDATAANPRAHDFLLRGDFFYERSHDGDLARSVDAYQKACDLDPHYSLAWARLGRAYVSSAGMDMAHPVGSMRLVARDVLQKALAENPDSAAAHRWLGRLNMDVEWDWTAAAREMRLANNADPDGPDGRAALEDLLYLKAITSGSVEAVLQHEREQLVRDPLNLSEILTLADLSSLAGRHADALELMRRAAEVDPQYQYLPSMTARILTYVGNTEAALSVAETITDEEERLTNLARIFWALRRTKESDEALDQLQHKYAENATYDIGSTFAYRGETEPAMSWLERAYKQHEPSMTRMKFDEALRPIRGDPRYLALLRRMRLAE